jgi:hypothetical protein
MGHGLRHSGLALTPVVLKEMAYFGPTIIAALVAGEMVANEDVGGALKTILVKGARLEILVTQLHAWHGPCESELAELLTTGGFRTDLALLQEAVREALEDAPP